MLNLNSSSTYPDPENRILLLMTHNDLIPNLQTDHGHTRFLFQNLVRSKLTQAGIPNQLFTTETDCQWDDELVLKYESEIQQALGDFHLDYNEILKDQPAKNKNYLQIGHQFCQKAGFGCVGDLTTDSKNNLASLLDTILNLT